MGDLILYAAIIIVFVLAVGGIVRFAKERRSHSGNTSGSGGGSSRGKTHSK